VEIKDINRPFLISLVEMLINIFFGYSQVLQI